MGGGWFLVPLGACWNSKAVSPTFQVERTKCENAGPPDSSLGQSPGDQISKDVGKEKIILFY